MHQSESLPSCNASEYLAIVDEMLKEHPEYLRKVEIGKSVEGRSLFVLLLGNAASTHAKEEVLITAGAHPMEAIPSLAALDYIGNMLDDIKRGIVEALYVTQRRLVVVHPFVNPDGIVANDAKGGGKMRKNRAKVCVDGGQQGVDIDLNFPGAPDTADSECSDRYGGKQPFDQPESQAIKGLVEKHKFVIALSIHANGRRIIYPDQATPAEKSFFSQHEEPSQVREIGSVSTMKKHRWHRSTGGMVNWMYDTHKILSTCLETGDKWWPKHNQKEILTSSTRKYIHFLVTKAGCDPMVSSNTGTLVIENTGLAMCHKLRVLVHNGADPTIIEVGDLDAGQKTTAAGTVSATVEASCVKEADVPFCVCNAGEDTKREWYRDTHKKCGYVPTTTTTTIDSEPPEDERWKWLAAAAGGIVILPIFLYLICSKCRRKKKRKKPHIVKRKRRPSRNDVRVPRWPKNAASAGFSSYGKRRKKKSRRRR